MNKKISCFLAVILLMQGLLVGTVQAAFNDIRGHWAEEEIVRLQDRQLISGYEDGSFRPDRSVTRAELATVTVRVSGVEAEEDLEAGFTDVAANHWAASSISAAKRLNIVSGYPDGSFRPNAFITRAEAAVLFDRVFRLEAAQAPASFADVQKSHWAADSIAGAFAKGIVRGDESGLFRPEQSLSRAEFASMLLRALDNAEGKVYDLELQRWGIYNDGTHPVETTQGLNKALAWAGEQGYKTFKVPAGTYLIAKGAKPSDPEARINMVSEMTLLLDDKAVMKKEANGFEAYQVLYLGADVHDVDIRGGTYQGDRNQHNYSQKDTPSSAGTHEAGVGIMVEGAARAVIDQVRAVDFTGDGVVVKGSGVGLVGLSGRLFERGAIDAEGKPVNSTSKIRIKEPLLLDHPIFETRRLITFWQPQGIEGKIFDVYFYDRDGKFLSSARDQTIGGLIPIPSGAESVIPVFPAKSTEGVFVSFWSNEVARNVTIQNSEIAFNRRQGISVTGGDNVVIHNNRLHDIGGTAPGYGIDSEGMGFFPISNLTITNNRLYNNRGDIVLADGRNGRIEGNRLESRIGFFGWEAFEDVVLARNHFQGNGIGMRSNGVIKDNTIVNGEVALLGKDILFADSEIIDGLLRIESSAPFGVEVSGVTLTNNNVRSNALYLGTQPTRLTDVTVVGKTRLSTIAGPGASGSEYENLKVTDYNVSNGTTLPQGLYNGCNFTSASQETNGLLINVPGTFRFTDCVFQANNKLIGLNHAQADVTVQDSEFILKGDVGYLAAVTVSKAKKLHWVNNTLRAERLTDGSKPLIKFGGFTTPEKTEIYEATFERNVFSANRSVHAVDTLNAGKDAPPYMFKSNKLVNTTLRVKRTDVVKE
ncbi:S-layer homology domain-containing protein [Paenibacillus sp.]|uniref:S-layer homology domain-containing protein n=1 Tax=Paenibacillus sp. TaxID=58172 RepID=UPI0028126B3F|nr:S-layer homology domain-containing protein [Paenibacillus sp.]